MLYLFLIIASIITCPPCVNPLVCDILNNIGLDPNEIFCPKIIIIPKPIPPTPQQMRRLNYLIKHWLEPSIHIEIDLYEWNLPDPIVWEVFPRQNVSRITVLYRTTNYYDFARMLK